MALKLEKLYNIYEERYHFTLNTIEDFQKSVDKGDFLKVIDSGEKLGVYILNRNLDKKFADK